MEPSTEAKSGHIRLTLHPGSRGRARFPLHWGAPNAAERGPRILLAATGAFTAVAPDELSCWGPSSLRFASTPGRSLPHRARALTALINKPSL